MNPRLSLAAAGFLVLPLSAQVAEWPQFMGPDRTAVVPALDTKFAWGDDGPEVLWRTETGPGYGGVAIKDGQVFLLDRVPGEMDLLRVIDLETGEDLWDFGYEAPGRLQFPGSRTVPAVTDDMVFTVGGQGRVLAVGREARDVAWEVDLEEIYGGELPMFGWSGSALVVGDTVIVTALGADVGLIAFDAKTGEERWITEGVGRSHSTPALLTLLGKQQIVFLSTTYQTSGQDEAAPTTISSYDPEDGTLLWRTETLLTRLPIPPPVQIDDERFFVTGGYRSGSTLLRITQEEGEYEFEELFHIARGSQVHAPVLHDEHLYLVVNENWNHTRRLKAEGGLLCLGLDGVEKWRTGEKPFFGRGNLLLAGDKLIAQDGENGTLRVMPATPDGFSVLAEANLFGLGPDERRDHEMWAPMAMTDGLLVLRSQEELICVRP